MSTGTPPDAFRIASDYVDALAALDPFAATSMGVPGHDAEVTDFSPEAAAERAGLILHTLDALQAGTVDNHDPDFTRAVIIDALRDELERHTAGDYFYEIRSIAGPVQSLKEVFDLMPRATAADWENVVRRLNGLPGAAASIERLGEAGLAAGAVSPRRQVDEVLRQLTSYAGGDPATPAAFTELPGDLEEAGVATPGLRADLERAIATARGAFTQLHDAIRTRYREAAPEGDAAGRERYARAVRAFLGMNLDPEETYAWGWSEVERLTAEMQATARRIRPHATVREAAEALDADPVRTIEGEAALLAWLQQVQDDALSQLDGVCFAIPTRVRQVEACIAPPGGPLAQYYTPPSEDFSRPGRIWYPTGGHTRFHRWRDLTTAYHEGVPGHHLQCAVAVHEADRLSRFQRLAVWYPGHGEGWALYAERLMAELGFLDDPGDYLGMLSGQMLRAVRVVVDIGAHLRLPIPVSSTFEPGQPWTFERMQAFLIDRAEAPLDMARSEALRYLGWPGQAIAYKVGERAWLALREESRARHGAAFSLKQFHTTALARGSMGLDLLRETLRAAY